MPAPPGDEHETPHDDGGDFFFSAWVTLAAFLPRLYVAVAWPREPVWDGHYYDFGARRIAAGLGYSDGTMSAWHPWCHWPVGYSGLLAGVYALIASGPHASTITGAVIGAATTFALHRLARYWLSPARARAAAILCALYPGFIAYAALVMTEPLSALVLVVVPWIVLATQRRAPLRGIFLAGMTLGAGALVHPTFLAYAPALALLVKVKKPTGRPLRGVASAAALSTAAAFLPVLPWTLRNCRVMDRCALISTNGGWNLAIGALDRATGRFETLHASDGCAVVTGQVQQDTCWRDRALAAIEADPTRWVKLVPKKLSFTFDHESFPVEYLHEADPDRWPEPIRNGGRALLTAFHRALLTLAVFALVGRNAASSAGRAAQLATAVIASACAIVAWESNGAFYLLPLSIALIGALPLPGAGAKGPVWRWILFSIMATILTHAVFFGEDRYHLVIVPLMCLLAAAAFRREDDQAAGSSASLRSGAAWGTRTSALRSS